MRGSLIDLLFQRQQKMKNHRTYITTINKSQNKTSGKIIKITQFNSAIMINDQQKQQKILSSLPTSPQKQFNIKKKSQNRNKTNSNINPISQNLIKKQKDFNLNRLNKMPFQISIKNVRSIGPQSSIQKVLITSRCQRIRQTSRNKLISSNIYINQQVFSSQKYDNNYYSASKQLYNWEKQQILTQTKDSLQQQLIKFESCQLENISTQLIEKKAIFSPRKSINSRMIQQKKYQQNLQKQKRQILQLKKQLNKNYAKPFNPPQGLSCQSYIIFQAYAKKIKYVATKNQQRLKSPQKQRKYLAHSHKVLASLNLRNSVEIASLTKIMTCILIIQLSQRYRINLQQEVQICHFSQNICGTTANLKKGQIYTQQNLLYGLMLPSGNDASLALALWWGKYLLNLQRSNLLPNQSSGNKKREQLDRFIQQMNSKAKILGMQKTHFANPHGLSCPDNYSCPFDLALLCQYSLKNQLFKKIVSTLVYECKIKLMDVTKSNNDECQVLDIVRNKQEEQGEDKFIQQQDQNQYNLNIQNTKQRQDKQFRYIRWENTHHLLQKKSYLYRGIKTGVTNTAGPCLASYIEASDRKFIIIVLNCSSMKQRFKDTQNLRKWLFEKQDIKKIQGQKQKNIIQY